MKYLIDTNVFLWFTTDDPKLTEELKNKISSLENEIILKYCQFMGNCNQDEPGQVDIQ